METPTDFLLFFNASEIFGNFSFEKLAHTHSYFPLLRHKALDSPKKIEVLDAMSKLFKVPYAFLFSELKGLVEDFRNRRNLKFPINLTKICEKWKAVSSSKSFCESLGALKRKTDSNETRSTDNEEPLVFSSSPEENLNLEQEASVILLGESGI